MVVSIKKRNLATELILLILLHGEKKTLTMILNKRKKVYCVDVCKPCKHY